MNAHHHKLRISTLLTAALLLSFGNGCVGADGETADASVDGPSTDVYRAALVSEEDVTLAYPEGESSGLNMMVGGIANTASLTAKAIVDTNRFMGQHFQMLRAITALPPSASTPSSRTWEGDHEGLHLRMHVEASPTPRGMHFDYSLTGRPAADDEATPLTIFDGDLVRITTREGVPGQQGFGIARFHFGNFSALKPEVEVTGTSRVAFRRVGQVRQVHVRMVGVSIPNDPQYPQAAEYVYTQLPAGGGSLRWFSRGDVKKDGAPFENVAVHTRWRGDRSGAGRAVAFGGSLEVDYWHLAECWDGRLIAGYERVEAPGFEQTTGEVASCFAQPDELEVPAQEENLPDEDPAVPGPHAEEIDGAE